MTDLGVTVDAVGRSRAWLLAARPRTLPAAVVPVVVGTALAAAEGRARALPATAALLSALLLQIGANFANDLFDFERGADTTERRGPARAVQRGWLTPAAMRAGTATAFGAAAAVGLYLVAVGGWPVAAAGAAAVAAGLAYTGGPWPYGYHGLGDVFVFSFFGVVAVTGTHYVQTLELSSRALALALPVGCLVTAILVVNNLRDLDGDRRAGKRTSAVRLGPRATRAGYVGLLGAAYAAPPLLWLGGGFGAWLLLPLASAPLALRLARRVTPHADAAALNVALAGTARLHAVFGALLALGLLL